MADAFAHCRDIPSFLFWRPVWLVHGARTTSGWSGVSCLFAAATVLPLADATAISFLSPLIAMLLAIPLLRESIGRWRWGAAGVAFAGALLLIRPGSGSFDPYALVALAAALFMGFEVICIKILSGGARSAGEPALRIMFVNNSIGTVIGLIAASTIWVTPTPEQCGLLAAIGVTMLSGQACFIQAMRRAEASFVMPAFYGTLVFAASYDLAVFGVVPSGLSVAGAALILSGALVLAWREGIRRQA